jgi:gamma-glutamyl-gamma-aminobutyrate hydrolase PuuD
MRPLFFSGGLLWLIFASGFTGCVGAPAEAPASDPGQDSMTVVLSKYYNSQNYRKWLGGIAEAEGLPPLRFFQAYGADSTALVQALDASVAVVLTGGEDIHPGRYGQAADTVRCGRIDEERDRVEHLLLDRVMEAGLPCLGVCRGLQFMNVHGGGSLHPHLPDAGYLGHRGGQAGNTKDTLHLVEVTSSWSSGDVAFTADLSGTYVSHHHQGIDRLAPGYRAWARAPGGLIEGIRYRDTLAVPFLVGVQWHPERSRSGEVLTDGLGLALLRAAVH